MPKPEKVPTTRWKSGCRCASANGDPSRHLKRHGIIAATIFRLENRAEVIRLARGLYQLSDASLHAEHALAEAAKVVPRGISAEPRRGKIAERGSSHPLASRN